MANATDELNLKVYLTNLYLNSHMWLVAAILENIGPRGRWEVVGLNSLFSSSSKI